jgi:hypothetical protein
MEDRRISVHQISASSSLDEKFLPDYGRLNVDANHGAWIALLLDTAQWYQVDFERIVKLIEIHTQGRTPDANEEQWVKEYTVSYAHHPDRIDSQFYQKNGQAKVKSFCSMHGSKLQSCNKKYTSRVMFPQTKTYYSSWDLQSQRT